MLCVRRSVCFWNRSDEGAGIHADPIDNMSRMRPGNFQDTRGYVLTTLYGSSKWVGWGGHLASDTWWLLSCD